MKMKPLIEEYLFQRGPEAVYKKLSEERFGFFLDSGMCPETVGRFSFIGMDPFLTFVSKGRNIEFTLDGWNKKMTGNPFYVLGGLLEKYRTDFRTGLFPFWGGAVGYFSYDMKNIVEELPDESEKDIDAPDCVCGFYDTVMVFDNLRKKSWIVSSGFPETGSRRMLRAKARLENFKERLTVNAYAKKQGFKAGVLSSNFSREDYMEAVLIAKEYIKRGDIYQVNLSQRFSTLFEGDPFSIYSKLRSSNPAPFAAYLNYGDLKVGSMSPERFIKINGAKIETRPIKGTRPRGRTKEEDARLKKELSESQKDKAENVMIVDLERNDLGRVSQYGSVNVSELMTSEEFPTVFHLTSTVEGRLKKGVGATDVLMNCFPGGSITGAPKIRAMEVIEELEGVKRGIYTGALGYIGFNGDMDTSVVIRTMVFEGNKLYFHAGGGIVHDSDPEMEYEETLVKANAFLEAIGVSQRAKVKGQK